jgi:hypothetical protein
MGLNRDTLDRNPRRVFPLGFSIALVCFILLYAAFKYPHSRPLYAAIMIGYVAAVWLVQRLQRYSG